MSEREYLRDLADLALHRSQFDLRCSAEHRRGMILTIEYLEARIRQRIDDGRSMDCDEYRTLLKYAGKAS